MFRKFLFSFAISLMLINTGFALRFQRIMIADTSTSIPYGRGTFFAFNEKHDEDGPYLYKNKVVFRGFGSHHQKGIYTNFFDGLSVVADRKTDIPESAGRFTSFGLPDSPSALNYFGFNSPSIGEYGIAFAGGGRGHQTGIYWLTRGKTLQKVANNKMLAPGLRSRFLQFDGPYVIGKAIYFEAVTVRHVEGIFRYERGRLHLLYATGRNNGFKHFYLTKIWNPSFSAHRVAFYGHTNKGFQGILADFGKRHALQEIVSKNNVIPGGYGRFTFIGGPSLNGNGLAFRGSGHRHQDGIYLYQNHRIRPVVDTHTKLPGSHRYFEHVYNPTLSDGNVLFTGKASDGRLGVYLYHRHQIHQIVREGDRLFGKKIVALQIGAVSISHHFIAIWSAFADGSSGIYLYKLRF